MFRERKVRMTDEMWEALAELAARNGRTTAEEARLAIDAWLKLAGNIDIKEERTGVRSPHPNIRQTHKMK